MNQGDWTRKPCAICAGDEFVWGNFGHPQGEVFYEDGATFWTLKTSGSPVRARRCRRCGNLQMFAPADE